VDDKAVAMVCERGVLLAEVRVLGAHDPHAELISLRDWLSHEEVLRGRVVLDQPVIRPGQMGGLADALQVAAGNAGVLTALAASLTMWVRNRRADVTIEVKHSDGRSVKVNAKRVPDDLATLIESVLDEHEHSKD
jgi:hypothetical protein